MGQHDEDKKKLGSGKHHPWTVMLLLASVVAVVIITVFAGAQLLQFKTCSTDVSIGRALEGQLGQEKAALVNDTGYKGLSEHPACAFLRSGGKQQTDEHHWGPYKLCDMDNGPGQWLRRSKANCYSCMDPKLNVCQNPPVVYYHQYLESLHPKEWQANLLSMQVYLLTQDLSRSKLLVWVPKPELVYTNQSAPFFDAFSDHITLQPFNYQSEIEGTVWKGDPFFGNGSLVKEMMPHAGSYSDVVRMLILHKYGGFWMDNDVVLYQDVTHLLATTYQFVMRWMNLHIMYMHAGSALTHRMMQLALTLPLNHPKFKEDIIEKRCKPIGYYQLVAASYGFTDVYNGCLHRLLLRHNNTGPPGAMLYDLPLGWWDHDWVGCFKSREAINDTHWHKMAGSYIAMHNRYPGDLNLGPETSPLRRVIKIAGDFFERCDNVHCLPVAGMPLLAYEGINEQPGKQRRLLLLLQQQQLQQRRLLREGVGVQAGAGAAVRQQRDMR